MKRITCEMCGSTDLIKKEGVFECQSCGTKYSLEEAKKMMVEGTVKIDTSENVRNFLELAENAYDAGNLVESESYCNKIIENDTRNYKAWFIKGKSAGWQSTLKNNRFSESVNCFAKAIEYGPEELKETIREDGTEEIKALGLALIRLRGKNFASYPDEEELKGFINDRITIINAISSYIRKGGSVPTEYNNEIANIMNISACSAWKEVVVPEFNDSGTEKNRPSDYGWNKMIGRATNCTSLIKLSIDEDEGDIEEDIQRYRNLITIHDFCINSCSYTREYTSYGTYWARSYILTDEAKKIRKEWIAQYEQKINELTAIVNEKKEKIKKERIEKYWAEHKEEKERLINEKNNLENKTNILLEQISSLPGKKKFDYNNEKIEERKQEKKNISIFKPKERKKIDEEIEQISNENEKIFASIKDQIEAWSEEVYKYSAKIESIDEELNKDRDIE